MPKKRPYDQFCPIARSLDTVGDRWSMLIVRELFLGPTRYGEFLDALAPISTDVLAKRLRELESTGVVERQDDGSYDLTARGRGLEPVLKALGQWGRPLLTSPDSASPDDALERTASRALQMLVISSAGLDLGAEQTIEVRAGELTFAVASSPNGLTARRGPASEADAVVTTDGETLWAVGLGDSTWAQMVASGAIQVNGNLAAAERLIAGSDAASVQSATT